MIYSGDCKIVGGIFEFYTIDDTANLLSVRSRNSLFDLDLSVSRIYDS